MYHSFSNSAYTWLCCVGDLSSFQKNRFNLKWIWKQLQIGHIHVLEVCQVLIWIWKQLQIGGLCKLEDTSMYWRFVKFPNEFGSICKHIDVVEVRRVSNWIGSIPNEFGSLCKVSIPNEFGSICKVGGQIHMLEVCQVSKWFAPPKWIWKHLQIVEQIHVLEVCQVSKGIAHLLEVC